MGSVDGGPGSGYDGAQFFFHRFKVNGLPLDTASEKRFHAAGQGQTATGYVVVQVILCLCAGAYMIVTMRKEDEE